MAEVLLVVDDDVDTLRLVGLMLQRQGYTILTATNGQQAINMALDEQPDLILLDVMMPGLDGYEVTRQLRNNPKSTEIPIIMFTAKTQLDDKVTGFEAGADDYLTKPTQPRELFAHVKAVLARSQKSRKSIQTSTFPDTERGKVIGILAAKGGLGVSTLAFNLGIALHQKSQQNTIVAEFRPGQGSIGLSLGYMRPDTINSLLDIATSELTTRDIKNCLITHNSGIKLLLSSYQPKDSRFISFGDSFATITQYLAKMAKFIILDLGPSLSNITDHIIDQCDDLIVIIEPTPITISQTRELLAEMSARGVNKEQVKIVLIDRISTDYDLTPTQVQEQLGEKIDLICPSATELLFQANSGHESIIISQPDSAITQQINKMAELILT